MIVVTDLVGTLTTGSPTLGLVNWVRYNQSSFRANFFMAKALIRYLPFKFGLLDVRTFGEWSMRAALPLIKDPTDKTLHEMAEWSVDKVLWPKRRHDVLDRLAHHKVQGDDLVIASSVFEPTVEALGRRLEARAIGSPMEIVDGRLEFIDLIEGKRKGPEVFKRLNVERIGAAYGDTWVDIPILERAEHPVAVYPDVKLRAKAIENDWEILE
jgi:phosphoserine phosphatase